MSVNHSLCGKLVSLVPIIFNDNLKVIPGPFFVDDFNWSSCKYDNLCLHCYIECFYFGITLNQK